MKYIVNFSKIFMKYIVYFMGKNTFQVVFENCFSSKSEEVSIEIKFEHLVKICHHF